LLLKAGYGEKNSAKTGKTRYVRGKDVKKKTEEGKKKPHSGDNSLKRTKRASSEKLNGNHIRKSQQEKEAKGGEKHNL